MRGLQLFQPTIPKSKRPTPTNFIQSGDAVITLRLAETCTLIEFHALKVSKNAFSFIEVGVANSLCCTSAQFYHRHPSPSACLIGP